MLCTQKQSRRRAVGSADNAERPKDACLFLDVLRLLWTDSVCTRYLSFILAVLAQPTTVTQPYLLCERRVLLGVWDIVPSACGVTFRRFSFVDLVFDEGDGESQRC